MLLRITTKFFQLILLWQKFKPTSTFQNLLLRVAKGTVQEQSDPSLDPRIL
jgi:hypothetical protein